MEVDAHFTREANNAATGHEADAAMLSNLPKVLYIAGYGRSGSTTIEMLIAQGQRVFGAGELCFLFDDYDKERSCSCGETVDICEIWGPIVRKVTDSLGLTAAEAHQLTYQTERHRNTADLVEYRELWRGVFTELVKLTSVQLVVDSSKTAEGRMRVVELVEIGLPALKVVELRRDPRGVITSVASGDNRLLSGDSEPGGGGASRIRGALGWARAAHTAARCRKTIPKADSAGLRYEQVADNPDITLGQTLSELGLAGFVPDEYDRTSLTAGHGLGGNRMRRSGPQSLRVPPSKQHDQITSALAAAALIASPKLD